MTPSLGAGSNLRGVIPPPETPTHPTMNQPSTGYKYQRTGKPVDYRNVRGTTTGPGAGIRGANPNFGELINDINYGRQQRGEQPIVPTGIQAGDQLSYNKDFGVAAGPGQGDNIYFDPTTQKKTFTNTGIPYVYTGNETSLQVDNTWVPVLKDSSKVDFSPDIQPNLPVYWDNTTNTYTNAATNFPLYEVNALEGGTTWSFKGQKQASIPQSALPQPSAQQPAAPVEETGFIKTNLEKLPQTVVSKFGLPQNVELTNDFKIFGVNVQQAIKDISLSQLGQYGSVIGNANPEVRTIAKTGWDLAALSFYAVKSWMDDPAKLFKLSIPDNLTPVGILQNVANIQLTPTEVATSQNIPEERKLWFLSHGTDESGNPIKGQSGGESVTAGLLMKLQPTYGDSNIIIENMDDYKKLEAGGKVVWKSRSQIDIDNMKNSLQSAMDELHQLRTGGAGEAVYKALNAAGNLQLGKAAEIISTADLSKPAVFEDDLMATAKSLGYSTDIAAPAIADPIMRRNRDIFAAAEFVKNKAQDLTDRGFATGSFEDLRKALDLTRLAGMGGLNMQDPYFAYTWIDRKDLESKYLDAAVTVELREGRPLTQLEAWTLRDTFVDPTKEFIGDMAFDALNFLDVELLFKPLGVLRKPIESVMQRFGTFAIEKIPVLTNTEPAVVDFFKHASARSAASKLAHSANEILLFMARTAEERGLNTAQFYDLVGQLGEALDKMDQAGIIAAGRNFGDREVEMSLRISRTLSDPKLADISPVKWTELLRTVKADVEAKLAKELTPQFAHLPVDQMNPAIDAAVKKVMDKPTNWMSDVAQVMKDEYTKANRAVRTGPIGTLMNFQDWYRSWWTKAVLATRPAWVMRNMADNMFRTAVFGMNPFEALNMFDPELTKKLIGMGILPSQLTSTFARSEVAKAGETIAQEFVKGDAPKNLWDVIVNNYRTLKDAQASALAAADFVNEPGVVGFLRNFGHGVKLGADTYMNSITDWNSIVEYSFRVRMFNEAFNRNTARLALSGQQIMLSRLASRGITDKTSIDAVNNIWNAARNSPVELKRMLQDMQMAEVTGRMSSMVPDEVKAVLAGLDENTQISFANYMEDKWKVFQALDKNATYTTGSGTVIDLSKMTDEERVNLFFDEFNKDIVDKRNALLNHPDLRDAPNVESPHAAANAANPDPLPENPMPVAGDTYLRTENLDKPTATQRLKEMTDNRNTISNFRDSMGDKVRVQEGKLKGVKYTVVADGDNIVITMDKALLKDGSQKVRLTLRDAVSDSIKLKYADDVATTFKGRIFSDDLMDFLKDPEAMLRYNPEQFRFFAEKFADNPSLAKTMASLSGRDYLKFLDVKDLGATIKLSDDMVDALKYMDGNPQELLKYSGPFSDAYHAGGTRQAAARFNMNQAKRAATVDKLIRKSEFLSTLDDRGTYLVSKLNQFFGQVWPGPLTKSGIYRARGWDLFFETKAKMYDAVAAVYERETARVAGLAEDAIGLNPELSFTDWMEQMGFHFEFKEDGSVSKIWMQRMNNDERVYMGKPIMDRFVEIMTGQRLVNSPDARHLLKEEIYTSGIDHIAKSSVMEDLMQKGADPILGVKKTLEFKQDLYALYDGFETPGVTREVWRQQVDTSFTMLNSMARTAADTLGMSYKDYLDKYLPKVVYMKEISDELRANGHLLNQELNYARNGWILKSKVVVDTAPNAMSADQWLQYLGNPQRGIKKAEMEEFGIADWLRGKEKTRVTKEELQSVLDERAVLFVPDQEVRVTGTGRGILTWGESEPAIDRMTGADTSVSWIGVAENGDEYQIEKSLDSDVFVLYNASGYEENTFSTLASAQRHAQRLNAVMSDTTKWSQYTLPGGTDYFEKLLTTNPSAAVQIPALKRARQEAELELKQLRDKIWTPELESLRKEASQYEDLLKSIDPRTGHTVFNSATLDQRTAALAKVDDYKARLSKMLEDNQANIAPGTEWALKGKVEDLGGKIDSITAENRFQYSVHWDDSENFFAHYRANTHESPGGSVFHIDEIQSDLHQQGRKVGYKDPEISARVAEANSRLDASMREVSDSNVGSEAAVNFDSGEIALTEEAQSNLMFKTVRAMDDPQVVKDLAEYDALAQKLSELGTNTAEFGNTVSRMSDLAHKLENAARTKVDFNYGIELTARQTAAQIEYEAALKNYNNVLEISNHGIPLFPYQNNWHTIAFKDALSEAVGKDAKYITWTTGRQQFERWGSIEVKWTPSMNTNYTLEKVGKQYRVKSLITGEIHDFNDVLAATDFKRSLESKNSWMVQLVQQGQPWGDIYQVEDVADLYQLPEEAGRDWAPGIWKKMQGSPEGGTSAPILDGMEGFYDQKLPQDVEKYLRSLGLKDAKVEDVKIYTEVAGRPEPLSPLEEPAFAGWLKEHHGFDVYRDDMSNIDSLQVRAWWDEFAGTKRVSTTVHGIKITDELKQAVTPGQLLYQKVNSLESATKVANDLWSKVMPADYPKDAKSINALADAIYRGVQKQPISKMVDNPVILDAAKRVLDLVEGKVAKVAGPSGKTIAMTKKMKAILEAAGKSSDAVVKGAFQYMPDGKNMLYMFQHGDVSTIMHEMAHQYRRVLQDLANVDVKFNADLAAILSWTGEKSWTIDAEEKFARAFERFVTDGVAPTTDLAPAFAKMSNWMKSIYVEIDQNSPMYGLDLDRKMDNGKTLRETFHGYFGGEGTPVKSVVDKIWIDHGVQVTPDLKYKIVRDVGGVTPPPEEVAAKAAEKIQANIDRGMSEVELDAAIEKRYGMPIDKVNDTIDTAFTDELTGIGNLKGYKRAEEAIVKSGKPASFMLVDTKGMKVTNDTFGHNAGDAFLKVVSKILNSDSRAVAYRTGGDEFRLIVKGDVKLANQIRQDLTHQVENVIIELNDTTETKFITGFGLHSGAGATYDEADAIEKLAHAEFERATQGDARLATKVDQLSDVDFARKLRDGSTVYGGRVGGYTVVTAEAQSRIDDLAKAGKLVFSDAAPTDLDNAQLIADTLRKNDSVLVDTNTGKIYGADVISAKPEEVLKSTEILKPETQAEALKNSPKLLLQVQEITKTPEFEVWFSGADKLLKNADGSPVVFYHGTTNNFNEFDPSKFGMNDAGWYGAGLYFSNEPYTASIYAGVREEFGKGYISEKSGANIMPVFLNPKNLLDLGAQRKVPASMLAQLTEVEKTELLNRSRFLWGPKLEDADMSNLTTVLEVGKWKHPEGSNRFAEIVKGAGYDGVYVGMGNEVVIYDPTNVKSVFNLGTFNPKDPNILMQVAEDRAITKQVELTPEETQAISKTVSLYNQNVKKEALHAEMMRAPRFISDPRIRNSMKLEAQQMMLEIYNISDFSKISNKEVFLASLEKEFSYGASLANLLKDEERPVQVLSEALKEVITGKAATNKPLNSQIRKAIIKNLEDGTGVRLPNPYIWDKLGRDHYDIQQLMGQYAYNPVEALDNLDEQMKNSQALWDAFIQNPWSNKQSIKSTWGALANDPDIFAARLKSIIADLSDPSNVVPVPSENIEALQLLQWQIENFKNISSDFSKSLSTVRYTNMMTDSRVPLGRSLTTLPENYRNWFSQANDAAAKMTQMADAGKAWKESILKSMKEGKPYLKLSPDEVKKIAAAAEDLSNLKQNMVDLALYGSNAKGTFFGYVQDVMDIQLSRDMKRKLVILQDEKGNIIKREWGLLDENEKKMVDTLKKSYADQQEIIKAVGNVPEGALPETNRWMIDYTDNTNFDEMMRRFIPFWTFSSRSMPFWASTLATHPEVLAFYYKYIAFTRRVQFNQGVSTSSGGQLPSLEGFIRIPGTGVWFNPTSPLSAKFIIPKNNNSYSDEFVDMSPMDQVAGWLTEYSQLFGVGLDPIFNVALDASGWLNNKPVNTFIPQTQLLPPWWRDYLRMKAGQVVGDSQMMMAPVHALFGKELPWQDYLIERRMLADGIQRMGAAGTQADKMKIAAELKAALNDREGNQLWDTTTRSMQESDLAKSWVGYFTGMYPKDFTDSEIQLLALRDDINFMRNSINDTVNAKIFGLDADAAARYNRYTDAKYNTPEGYAYGVYNIMRYTQAPDGSQLTGQARRDYIAQKIHEDEVTNAYYDSKRNLQQTLQAELAVFPVGTEWALLQPAYDKYNKAVKALNDDPTYDVAKRPWSLGYKPEGVIVDHFKDLWYNTIRETRPVYDAGKEDYTAYTQRVADWEQNLPNAAASLMAAFEKGMPEILGMTPDEYATALQNGGFDLQGARKLDGQKLLAELQSKTTIEDFNKWKMSKDNEIDALTGAWTTLYWDKYWAAINGKSGMDREVAERQFFADYPKPSNDELTLWVQTNYPGRFKPEDLMTVLTKAGVQSVQDRNAPKTDEDRRATEIWDILFMAGPKKSKLQAEYEKLGGYWSDISTWYNVGGNPSAWSKPENFMAMYEKLKQAAKNLGLSDPNDATVKEWAAAQDLDTKLKGMYSQILGPDYLSTMTEYWNGDRQQRAALRKANPIIDQYYAIYDKFATDNPLWAKYYTDTSTSTSTSSSGTGTSKSGSKGYSGGSYYKSSSGGGGGGSSSSKKSGSNMVRIGYRSNLDANKLPGSLGKGGAGGTIFIPDYLAEVLGTVAVAQLNEPPIDAKLQAFLDGVATRNPQYASIINDIKANPGIPVKIGD